MTTDSETPDPSSLIQGPLFGTVHLKDWLELPINKNSVKMVQGMITAFENKSLVGFDASNKEANWCIRVEGKIDKMYIFGCQIRAITLHVDTKEQLLTVHRVP